MIYRIFFKNGCKIDIDIIEFGLEDRMGSIIDHLAAKHGGVVSIIQK